MSRAGILRLAVIGAALLLMGAAACGGGGGDENTIKIVSSLPRTGSSKGQTDTIVNAIKMCLEEHNYQAGRFKLKYEDWDDATAAKGQWDAAKESENANKAVNDKDVMVYIGTFNSGAAKVSIPHLEQGQLGDDQPGQHLPGANQAGQG